MIVYQATITRDDVQKNTDTLYVFGDNMRGLGYGGQAKAMRGEPNAIGIPTKWSPCMYDECFFKDSDLDNPLVKAAIDSAFERLEAWARIKGKIVMPSAGIGTGFAQLEIRAPRIQKYIQQKWKALEEYDV